MARTLALRVLVVAAAFAGAGGCGQPATPQPDPAGSVSTLVTEAGRHWHVEYTPLASPADAVRRADLIVTGTLVDVTEGITVERPDGDDGDTWATFEVRVERVLAARTPVQKRGSPVGSVIHVAVGKSVAVTTDRLAALNPQARAVLVLVDRSDWTAAADVTVTRPAGIPATAPLYMPYTDGMWLQGPKDNRMYAVQTEPADLLPAWSSPSTVEQFADRITAAGAPPEPSRYARRASRSSTSI
jgi:hypothetical protein